MKWLFFTSYTNSTRYKPSIFIQNVVASGIGDKIALGFLDTDALTVFVRVSNALLGLFIKLAVFFYVL